MKKEEDRSEQVVTKEEYSEIVDQLTIFANKCRSRNLGLLGDLAAASKDLMMVLDKLQQADHISSVSLQVVVDNNHTAEDTHVVANIQQHPYVIAHWLCMMLADNMKTLRICGFPEIRDRDSLATPESCGECPVSTICMARFPDDITTRCPGPSAKRVLN